MSPWQGTHVLFIKQVLDLFILCFMTHLSKDANLITLNFDLCEEYKINLSQSRVFLFNLLFVLELC